MNLSGNYCELNIKDPITYAFFQSNHKVGFFRDRGGNAHGCKSAFSCDLCVGL